MHKLMLLFATVSPHFSYFSMCKDDVSLYIHNRILQALQIIHFINYIHVYIVSHQLHFILRLFMHKAYNNSYYCYCCFSIKLIAIVVIIELIEIMLLGGDKWYVFENVHRFYCLLKL